MDLYYMPTCPHCHRVMQWIEEHDDTNRFTYIDVTESDANAERLERVEGGQGYVPCLDDHGHIIIGDGPIIGYLEQKLSLTV